MKKLTKAAIAAAAGTALLLGTGATLASWNASVNAGATAAISAGQLKITQTGTPAWTLGHGALAPVAANPASVKLVPGDVLTYTGTYDITAQGDNLEFTVGTTSGSIAATTSGAADVALVGLLQANTAFTVDTGSGPQPVTSGTPITIKHDSATSATHPVKVTATITWPSGTPAADNPAMLGSVSLSNFTITLTQTARTS